ncbi:hypothetical protein G210_1607 [Candida maltosa Xu316]|uniref:Uncharacterized protein n=1 Tax=Candida maltosa (strain Xu316) TaxID=1245528 RepID=M3JY68_CANMX|nr:hypothetical protein G210_1607 [Candida maltosa Xu316]
MTYELPPLDSELEEELKIIIENKTFDPNIAKTSWESGILPKVISRLDQLVELSKNQSGDNVYDTIKKINDRIKSHLMSLMSTSPPFTIHRIAEIVLDPNGQC